MGITYVTGHQSSCIPANQDNGFVGEMAVNLCGKRETIVRQEATTGCKTSPACWVCQWPETRALSPPALCFSQPQSYAQDTAELLPHYHCSADEWLQGWPTGNKVEVVPAEIKFQISSQFCLTYPKSLQPWINTIRIKNKKKVGVMLNI